MNRPYEPIGLDNGLTKQLDSFIQEHDFVKLYMSYSWKNDRHDTGFKDIFLLESQFNDQDKSTISLQDVKDVAKWGGLPRAEGVEIIDPESFKLLCRILQGRIQIEEVGHVTKSMPGVPAKLMDESVKGIGPTYVSKVLRFALPVQYGAIDTRCVRVLGNGDSLSNRNRWLQLVAHRPDKKVNRWAIQSYNYNWTDGYGTWTNILRYFAHKLPDNCPHPQNFVDAGLRDKGVWTCADVEMALFAYASGVISARR